MKEEAPKMKEHARVLLIGYNIQRSWKDVRSLVLRKGIARDDLLLSVHFSNFVLKLNAPTF